MPSPGSDPLDVADAALDAARLRIRTAGSHVAKASRGRLIRYGVGVDPHGRVAHNWWARADLNVGRPPGSRITVDGFANGIEAAEALAETIDGWMQAHHIEAFR